MAAERSYTASLIIIGNEILSGRTCDANLQYLGRELGQLGIRMVEARVIPDIESVIVDTVNQARAAVDYVFTSGGIGPTHDDITAAAIAKAFGVDLRPDPVAVAMLNSHYRPEDRTAARMKMAQVPAGAVLLENPVSKAPEFNIGNVYVLPGVPRILQAIFEGFRHTLAGGAPVRSHTISSHVPEGEIAARLTALQNAYEALEIGSYPFMRDGKPGASIVLRGTDEAVIASAARDLRALITELGGAPIEDTPLGGTSSEKETGEAVLDTAPAAAVRAARIPA